MGYSNHLEGLLAEKEEKIRLLEGHNSAYTARISLLQSRLLTALDTLDSVQITHAQEIADLEDKMALLKEQLYRYNDVAKTAEEERDDMRDAVMKLVEKVEASNDDYSTWPHNQIYLSRLEDPVAGFDLKRSNHPSEDDLLSYAASMIEALRKERDNERQSHVHTRATFEARMVALEAQLSRREAELATCATHIHHDIAGHLSAQEDVQLRHDMVDSDQIISVLDVTVARNKVLELEIKSLAKRLENARFNQGSPSSPLAKPGQATTNSATEGLEVSSQDAKHIQASFPKRQIPPPVLDRDREIQLQGLNTVLGPSLDAPQHALYELDRDIRQLGEKVDAFIQERNNLRQTISPAARDQRNPHSIGEDEKIDLESRIQVLEEECDRLRNLEQNLRNELELTRAAAHAREAELMEEIATLKLDQNDTERVPVAALLELDESDGEMSMELATPLMPTSIMATSSTPAQDIPISISRTPSPSSSPPYVGDEVGNTTPNSESLSMPLPSSPHMTSEPSDTASPRSEVISSDDRSPASLPPQLVAEIVEREEAELIDRQRQIEVGEAALGELVELVRELNS